MSTLTKFLKQLNAINEICRSSWSEELCSQNRFQGHIGMESFGASGAVETVYEKFGITATHVVKEIEARL